MRLLVIAVALSSVASFAIAPGAPMFVVVGDAAVLKDPSAKSPKLVALQRGDMVRWMGASEKDKRFHMIQARGKTGYVLLSALTPSLRISEFDEATGKPMAAQAFASSGANNKDDRMGSSAPRETPITRELSRLTELNRNTATPTALDQKRSELSK